MQKQGKNNKEKEFEQRGEELIKNLTNDDHFL